MAVEVEKSGPVSTVILDRPSVRNAVDPGTADALLAAFLAFDADESQRVAVLWGAGGSFCAGWDLKHGASLLDRAEPLARHGFPDGDGEPPCGPLGPTRLALDKPVIAAISGAAVAGGLELALWCDLRIMEEDAFAGVFNRRWGIPLMDGGTVRLPRLVGAGRATELILTGRRVMAEECLRIGLCERVVARGTARAEAEALASALAAFPQAGLRADLRSLRGQHGLELREAMRREWQGGLAALETEGLAGAARFAGGAGRHGQSCNPPG
ncbi:crotonase/enoyl-CoA hydratase family protein [Marinimicrococcus flavescens]|uniref:Crotonase/enoyl-CoA hydratase family protein n=1 Tax=Marinimicrococcus flavescens TaxID=3031815 RepID=A0AAP3XRN6_9PROT|nr:crotonase/enoyl-CoA hydratase family protein [Marinimicrococcus flavescens]